MFAHGVEIARQKAATDAITSDAEAESRINSELCGLMCKRLDAGRRATEKLLGVVQGLAGAEASYLRAMNAVSKVGKGRHQYLFVSMQSHSGVKESASFLTIGPCVYLAYADAFFGNWKCNQLIFLQGTQIDAKRIDQSGFCLFLLPQWPDHRVRSGAQEKEGWALGGLCGQPRVAPYRVSATSKSQLNSRLKQVVVVVKVYAPIHVAGEPGGGVRWRIAAWGVERFRSAAGGGGRSALRGAGSAFGGDPHPAGGRLHSAQAVYPAQR